MPPKRVKRAGSRYTQSDVDAVSSPPLTAARLRKMRPAKEILPEIVEEYRKTRGPGRKLAKVPISLRVERSIIEGYKAKANGEGWQKLMHAALVAGLTRNAKSGRRKRAAKKFASRPPAKRRRKAKAARG
jgi:uncharacterized protein (DUF4415 family)